MSEYTQIIRLIAHLDNEDRRCVEHNRLVILDLVPDVAREDDCPDVDGTLETTCVHFRSQIPSLVSIL